MKIYLVAKSKPWGCSRTYVDAYVYKGRETYDKLSCDAFAPILKVVASSRDDAKREFRRLSREYHAVHNNT